MTLRLLFHLIAATRSEGKFLNHRLFLPACLIGLALLLAGQIQAQTFTPLRSLSLASDGSGPGGGLTLSGGMLYGANATGGSSNAGTVFKMGLNGEAFTVLHHFAGGSEGLAPIGRVVVSGETIYGVTQLGGVRDVQDGGVIYKVNTDGSNFSVLRRFNRAAGDGFKPDSGLVISGDVLYGTTLEGGVSSRGTLDRGVVFSINVNGSGYQNIHAFSGYEDGEQPEAELTIIGSHLFGTTAFSQFGGKGGVLFGQNLDGTGFTVLYTFPVTLSLLGGGKNGRLTPVDNVFYGVGAFYQNNEVRASIYKINLNGAGFQIIKQLPPGWTMTGPLVWTGHELLGTSAGGDFGNVSQIFQVKTNGADYQVLKTLDASEATYLAGDFALSGPTFYGGGQRDGVENPGTLFSFDIRPRLVVSATGDILKISWPGYAGGYQLEQRSFLEVSNWIPFASPPEGDGANWTATSLSSMADQTYFRLTR